MYDCIIKGGRIVDGTGRAPYVADLGIRDGKIARITEGLTGGDSVIAAHGLTVTPGFIDSHSHSDNAVLAFPDQIEKIEQGITTAIGGQCGNSPAPLAQPAQVQIGDAALTYQTMGELMQIAENLPMGANLATFVGHSSLRRAVIGTYDQAPTPEQLEQMGQLLQDGMAHGALGVSFGLISRPGCFAQTQELTYLARVAARCGGVVAAHIRDEGHKLLEACEEFISVVKASGARGVFSHHKAMYQENWGKVQQSLARIDQANREGCDIYCDVYPYTASHSTLGARFIPKQYRSGGDAALVGHLSDPVTRAAIRQHIIRTFGQDPMDWVLLTICSKTPQFEGLRLNQVAQQLGMEAADAVLYLLQQNGGVCRACFFLMCEEDLETVLAHPRAMPCTDATVQGKSQVYHPRLRGAFPRVLGRYVRQRKLVPLEEMIRKMTALPAAVYRLQGKGILQEGYDADICIFDAETILDRATYTHCHRRAEGLRYVLVDGKVVVENAVYNGTKAGRLLSPQTP